jgi:hypothetical protein
VFDSCSLLKPDRLEQQRVIGRAFSHLSTSLAAWNSLQHIQLLCNSYKQCQDRLWAGQDLEVQVPYASWDSSLLDTEITPPPHTHTHTGLSPFHASA